MPEILDFEFKPFPVQNYIAGKVVEQFQARYQQYKSSYNPSTPYNQARTYGDLGPGYLCPESAFAEGGYEPSNSRFAPNAERIYHREIADLMKKLH